MVGSVEEQARAAVRIYISASTCIKSMSNLRITAHRGHGFQSNVNAAFVADSPPESLIFGSIMKSPRGLARNRVDSFQLTTMTWNR